MGPLLFTLALQDSSEDLQAGNLLALVVAYADDMFLQGPSFDFVASFRHLVDLAQRVGLQAELRKCAAYSSDPATATVVGEELGIRHARDGLLAAGTPVGAPHFIAAHVALVECRRCRDTTLDLPSARDRLELLLAGSLQLHMAHLPCISKWEYVEQAIQDTEDRVVASAFASMDRQPQCGMFHEQVTLPRRRAGLGLRCTSALECHAAYMSAAAWAQISMAEGPEAFQPSWDRPRPV
jgi:hypothetical protein